MMMEEGGGREVEKSDYVEPPRGWRERGRARTILRQRKAGCDGGTSEQEEEKERRRWWTWEGALWQSRVGERS